MINDSVLVLNANYIPLSIVSTQRAIGLLILDKVETIENCNDKFIRSEKFTIHYPLVVRLLNYVNIDHNLIFTKTPSKKRILLRDNNTCAYCMSKGTTIDHIIPSSRGGKDEWKNLVCACLKCNLLKGNKTPQEANMKLHFKPSVPATFISYQYFRNNNPVWSKYFD